LRRIEPQLRSLGARLLFVGNGTPPMAAGFAREHAGPWPVFTDPERGLYRAAGLRRSLGASLHWRLLKNAWRALRGGFRQGRVAGDPWQQGGVLVLDAAGKVRHVQVDATGGDLVDLDAVLAASG